VHAHRASYGGDATHEAAPPEAVEPLPAVQDLGAAADNTEAVKRVVQANFKELTACYEEALGRDPEVGGRIETEWQVAAGSVTSASILSNDTGDDVLGECLSAKIAAWTVAEELEGRVVYPLVFKPAP